MPNAATVKFTYADNLGQSLWQPFPGSVGLHVGWIVRPGSLSVTDYPPENLPHAL